MTKADLIAAVAADAGIKKSVAEKALDAVVEQHIRTSPEKRR